MKGLLKPTQMEMANNAIDITEPMYGVEVILDHVRNVVHVNVDGICVLRICRIKGPIHVTTTGAPDGKIRNK